MNIVVTGANVEVAEGIRAYVAQKLQRLSRHFNHLQEAKVVMREERRRPVGRAQVVEVTVWGDGFVLRGEEAAADPYASVDRIVDKLEKQIARHRSRLIRKRRLDERRQRTVQRARAEAAAQQEPEPLSPRVVRRKRFPMKPMTEEDAVLQMELLGHDFFVYRDADTGRICVLYRRKDGDYGVIEAE
ncbi:MAG: ribosome-associated translation inhibitor RaiA [Armatimonadota bacterium]|nr:ribosome-associated translation inhibitor RaiA [Armatimonadota bacterium]MDR5675175.1 ribosome-associated translation inhibitor RaiA [Armatimonadota bacterium]MDR5689959.1 ribosome-associated translation inhibitor RaiA [Armatimonadota bacterium]MDR7389742.1 ribosome-associated translation inhibitor RaiA [Armatimonadota bacterium]MDR7390913.1 ribosome-associated translation inhibitor RaiA [Armatimonadota bacterium]